MKSHALISWPRDRAPLALVWAAFVVWIANNLFLDIRNAVMHPEPTDLSAYVAAAYVKSDAGHGIHDMNKLLEAGERAGVTGDARSFFYPPPFAEALVGVYGISFLKIRVAWIVLTYLSVVALFALIIRVSQAHGAPPLSSALLTFGVFVSYSPIQREIFYGQASLLCATLVAAAFLLERQGRAIAAGAAAGLATILKIYPGVLFVGFLLMRRWVPFAAGILAMGLIALVSVASYGLADWLSFLEVHLAEGASAAIIYADPGKSFLDAPNYSLTHVLYLWTQAIGLDVPGGVLSRTARVVLLAGGVAFIYAFRRQLRDTGSLVLWCHAILLFFLPSSVVFWNHIYVFYLPGLVLTGVALLAAREVPAGLWLLWLGGAALIGLVDYAPNIGLLNTPPLLVFKPVKFYGLVLHALAFTWMLRRGLLVPPQEART